MNHKCEQYTVRSSGKHFPLVFSPNSQMLAMALPGGGIHLYGINSNGDWVIKHRVSCAEVQDLLSFTADNRYLVAKADHKIKLLEITCRSRDLTSVGPGQASVFEDIPERDEPSPSSSRLCHSQRNLSGRFASRVANCLHHIAQVLGRFVVEIGHWLSSCCTCCPLISRADPESNIQTI